MKGRLLATAAVFFGTILTGCAGYGGGMMVRSAPPPPRYAMIGRAPGPGYVWTDGYWDWRGGRWFWVDSRWLRPPRPRAAWVPGRWVETRHGQWRFQRGRWRY
jgi:hypothetical protein